MGFPALRSVHLITPSFISGVTRNSAGDPLGFCTVNLFLTATNTLAASTISDANGVFNFPLISNTPQYYMVAYLVGSPDVEGTTVNTVTGT